jgi:hypothetical protein
LRLSEKAEMTVSPLVPSRTMLPFDTPAGRGTATTTTHPARLAYDDEDTAHTVWEQLAPLLSGTGRMRLRAFDPAVNRHVYPRPNLRIDPHLPDVPAAVTLYNSRRHTDLLVCDFDPAGHPVGQVDADARAAVSFFAGLGVRVICDSAPTGGRHLLVPLGEPVHNDRIKVLTRLLKRMWPTLDTSCSNHPTEGCITPPGSRSKHGGFRTLDTPLVDAIRIATVRNPATVIGDVVDAARKIVGPDPDDAPEPTPAARPSSPLRLPALAHRIAMTGQWPAERTRPDGAPWTRSEACFCVIRAAQRNALTRTETEHQMTSGRWPGLLDLYVSRYGTQWLRNFRADWHRGTRAPSQNSTSKPSSVTPTQEVRSTGGITTNPGSPSQRQTERAFVHQWLAAAETIVDQHHRTVAGHAVLAVVHALAYLAWRTGTRIVSAGVRSYSHAAAGTVDYTTTAEVLKMLREEPATRRLIRRLTSANGRNADQFELILPAGMTPDADPWAGNRTIRPVPPVFGTPDPTGTGHLGTTGWRVYRALVRGATGTVTDIAETAGVGRTRTTEALMTLETLGLARISTTGAWTLGAADPVTAGSPALTREHLLELHARHRADRAAWRAVLDRYLQQRRRGIPPVDEPSTDPYLDRQRTGDEPPVPWPDLTDDDIPEPVQVCDTVDYHAAAINLLSDVFGGIQIVTSPETPPPVRRGPWLARQAARERRERQAARL